MRKLTYQRIKWTLAIASSFLLGWLMVRKLFSQHILLSASPIRNYFLERGEYERLGFVLDTSTCKIPKIELVHSSIAHLIETPHKYDCAKNRRWSYVIGQKLYLNTTRMDEEGYPLHMLLCCYKRIERVPQDPDRYDEEVDSTVRFSSTCTPMEEVNQPKDEYIVVVCKLRYLVNEHENIYLYKYFHAIAQPISSINTRRKVEYWKTQLASTRPPNIIIVGMDSTSRLNFNRQMPETHRILQEMDVVELYGYTKVGYNTFPNSVPFFSGYSEEELRQICMYSSDTKQDFCPYIWKRFDEANYWTAHVEDSPLLMAFNNFKVGFVEQPVDYYLRTLMLAVYKNEGNYPLTIDCVGNQTVDEFILLYMEHLLEMSDDFKIPIFLSSWLTNVAHDNWNQIHEVDDVYSGFLKRLREKKLLTNSILFVMGDHGYNYGPFRNTFSGWYESKLPNMKIVLSEDLKEKYPSWRDNLIRNSRRLTSPYDLYGTFSHVLDTFTTTQKPGDSFNLSMALIRRKYGESFFNTIEKDRTCEEAGIPDSYCACSLPVKLKLEEFPELERGAHFIINYINNNLIPLSVCKALELHEVLGGSKLTVDFQNQNNINDSSMVGYIITFQTQPGDFIFETDFYFSNFTGAFQLPSSPNIQRLSKFNTHVGCVSNSNQQLYCYCK